MSNQLMPVVDLVKNNVSLFEEANTKQLVSWHQESQFAIQALQANDFLAKIAQQNPVSIQNAVINLAAVGITLNPAMKNAYLIPRKVGGKMAVCLDISYMGLMHIAMDSGSIRWGQSVIVRKNDNFKLTALGERPIHEHDPFGDRGEIVGVYCTVKTSDGDYLTNCMSIDDVYAIRARSESFKKGMGPWVSDPEEMIKKTAVKQGYKYWPKVERLATAIEYQNTQAGEGIELEPVMAHVTDEQQAENTAEQTQDLAGVVQGLVNKMEQAQTPNQLKEPFQEAYKLTKDHKAMSQDVQKIYAKNKQRLGM